MCQHEGVSMKVIRRVWRRVGGEGREPHEPRAVNSAYCGSNLMVPKVHKFQVNVALASKNNPNPPKTLNVDSRTRVIG